MIDRTRLLQLETELGAAALGEIVDAFLGEAGEAVAALGASPPGGPAETRARLHFLKGCAGAIGATRLGDLCERLEDARPLSGDDLLSLRRAFAAVRDALAREGMRRAG